ncbi:YheC/YheD family endospore coat-associated protein [Pontibacillus litoralis]|uniref:ATP-grasp domain-containing protein n=1 Tax=Pontibacillus litoralis JSM 072002 TaxID=1385512 RepID=A0A0A5G2H5_9BACI|nr:YheC/YheD family protein [Pontibacillus litoralis]KGX85290.1 hypothetical protein N784_09625 [Pontibacillus litoralis JSM 072002]
MECFQFNLRSYESHKNRIIVPMDAYRSFKHVQAIYFGIKEEAIEVMTHQKNDATIYLSQSIINKLHIERLSLSTCYVQGEQLIIQPYLGVFTAGFDSSSSRPLGERTAVMENMAQAGEAYGWETAFFGYQHINWEANTINAFTFHDSKWQRQTFPIPHIIYDRIPNRQVEHHPSVHEAKRKLKLHSQWFNEGFFNKWKIYDQLIRIQGVAHLLPPTVLHPSSDKLFDMIQKHGSVYIKPIHGSKGIGIKKCTLLTQLEAIECSYYVDEKKVHNRYYHFDQLMKQQFPNGLAGYIVQPAIALQTIRSTPIDYRVHTNKNEKNEWEVSVVCCKFAGKGSLTTHVQRGGSVHTLTDIYADSESQVIFNKLERAALLVSNTLHHQSKTPLGELGLDFGIDEEGEIWLFEVNSKPGYAIFEHPFYRQQQSVILTYPYQFATYLQQAIFHLKKEPLFS